MACLNVCCVFLLFYVSARVLSSFVQTCVPSLLSQQGTFRLSSGAGGEKKNSGLGTTSCLHPWKFVPWFV